MRPILKMNVTMTIELMMGQAGKRLIADLIR